MNFKTTAIADKITDPNKISERKYSVCERLGCHIARISEEPPEYSEGWEDEPEVIEEFPCPFSRNSQCYFWQLGEAFSRGCLNNEIQGNWVGKWVVGCPIDALASWRRKALATPRRVFYREGKWVKAEELLPR
jgi:hypothetical protein